VEWGGPRSGYAMACTPLTVSAAQRSPAAVLHRVPNCLTRSAPVMQASSTASTLQALDHGDRTATASPSPSL
jgi:hypothetical protein